MSAVFHEDEQLTMLGVFLPRETGRRVEGRLSSASWFLVDPSVPRGWLTDGGGSIPAQSYQEDALKGGYCWVLVGCKEESGKHQHATYHTHPSFPYSLCFRGFRTLIRPADGHCLHQRALALAQRVRAVCRTLEFESLAYHVRSIHTQGYKRSR